MLYFNHQGKKGAARVNAEHQSAPKRKTTTSTAVKAKYNKKTYSQILIQLPKETAAAFRAKCTAEGVPQTQILRGAIEEYLKK